MIEVQELDDGSFSISWDENDPVESKLNEWTEQDFIDCILKTVSNHLPKAKAPIISQASTPKQMKDYV